MNLLRAVGLARSYAGRVALRDFDLSVSPGEVVGLLGLNGAGKTTAISILAGVLRPDRGSVEVDGRDLLREPLLAKRALGLVPQELALYADLSVAENLRFFGRLRGLRGRELEASLAYALSAVELVDRARDPVRELSGGMQRRINVAVGLLGSPRLLILDEPAVGVDALSRAQLFQLVQRLAQVENLGILYTSHYLEEVAALCTRLVILHQGRIVAQGRLDELASRVGEESVELEVDGPLDALAAVLSAQRVQRAAGERLVLASPHDLAPLVATIEAHGGRLKQLRVLGRDLESLFLRYTGVEAEHLPSAVPAAAAAAAAREEVRR
ncbi:MAG: ABC transporter ATP-binding protein [Planctomycetes bacterium]|nr:ABC transporter ATP-binding protein [Planctomycetota bacterium]